MIIVPATVATVLTRRERHGAAAWEPWLRVVDVRRIASSWWLVTAFLYMPFVSLLSYAIMRALGLALPAVVYVPRAQTPVTFAVYFFGAIFAPSDPRIPITSNFVYLRGAQKAVQRVAPVFDRGECIRIELTVLG